MTRTSIRGIQIYRKVNAKYDTVGRLRGIEGLSSPVLGRESEISALREVLAKLHQGSRSIVCLIGEAGIGKSRLLDELHSEWGKIAGSEAPWVVSRGFSYDTTRPYGLATQRLSQIYGVEETDSLELVREKIAKNRWAFHLISRVWYSVLLRRCWL